jgi:hypothetical protein
MKEVVGVLAIASKDTNNLSEHIGKIPMSSHAARKRGMMKVIKRIR